MILNDLHATSSEIEEESSVHMNPLLIEHMTNELSQLNKSVHKNTVLNERKRRWISILYPCLPS